MKALFVCFIFLFISDSARSASTSRQKRSDSAAAFDKVRYTFSSLHDFLSIESLHPIHRRHSTIDPFTLTRNCVRVVRVRHAHSISRQGIYMDQDSLTNAESYYASVNQALDLLFVPLSRPMWSLKRGGNVKWGPSTGSSRRLWKRALKNHYGEYNSVLRIRIFWLLPNDMFLARVATHSPLVMASYSSRVRICSYSCRVHLLRVTISGLSRECRSTLTRFAVNRFPADLKASNDYVYLLQMSEMNENETLPISFRLELLHLGRQSCM